MINLKKLYTDYPECFKDSAKFKAYLIDLYPEEKKARINVLTTLLAEGVIASAQTEDKFDDAAFCQRICGDYGYSDTLVKECFASFEGIFSDTTAEAFFIESKQKTFVKETENEPYVELKPLVKKSGRVTVFDIETSGLSSVNDCIIEFGALTFTLGKDDRLQTQEHGFYIHFDKLLSPEIVTLTGITDSTLRTKGIDRMEAEQKITDILFGGGGLICAYNAQFDLSFVYSLLKKQGKSDRVSRCTYFDIMTVYKDRAAYPHKLVNAMANYHLSYGRMHDACDDAKAEAAVLCKMIAEKDDIEKYLNLFGYNPRYGVNGERLDVIYYAPQPYNMRQPLYETDNNYKNAQEKVKAVVSKMQKKSQPEDKEYVAVGDTVGFITGKSEDGKIQVTFSNGYTTRYPQSAIKHISREEYTKTLKSAKWIQSSKARYDCKDEDDTDYYERERQIEYDEEYLPEYQISDDDPDYPDYYWEDLDD